MRRCCVSLRCSQRRTRDPGPPTTALAALLDIHAPRNRERAGGHLGFSPPGSGYRRTPHQESLISLYLTLSALIVGSEMGIQKIGISARLADLARCLWANQGRDGRVLVVNNRVGFHEDWEGEVRQALRDGLVVTVLPPIEALSARTFAAATSSPSASHASYAARSRAHTSTELPRSYVASFGARQTVGW